MAFKLSDKIKFLNPTFDLGTGEEEDDGTIAGIDLKSLVIVKDGKVTDVDGNALSITVDDTEKFGGKTVYEWTDLLCENFEVMDTDKDVETGKTYLVDTSNGKLTAKLPTDAKIYDRIKFIDIKDNFNNNTLTIDRNGSKINGSEENIELDLSNTYTAICIGDGLWVVN